MTGEQLGSPHPLASGPAEMREAFERLKAMGPLAIYTGCETDAERRAAEAGNMARILQYGECQNVLLRRINDVFPDRSVGAIWRRAFSRSIRMGDDRNRPIRSRQWKARALGLDPEPMHNSIALSGMAPLQVEERWMLAVALPQPAPIGDLGFGIEDVLLIDPKSGRASLMFDTGATHVAPPEGWAESANGGRLEVMTDAKAWARSVALNRLGWFHLRKQRREMLQAEPTWVGWDYPALLLVPPKKMRWSSLSAPILQVPADMRETVRRAVFAEARLPRIEGRA